MRETVTETADRRHAAAHREAVIRTTAQGARLRSALEAACRLSDTELAHLFDQALEEVLAIPARRTAVETVVQVLTSPRAD